MPTRYAGWPAILSNAETSSLSDLGLIYCDGRKSVHFRDNFRQIIPLFSSNDHKTFLDFPPVSLQSPKPDRLLAPTVNKAQ